MSELKHRTIETNGSACTSRTGTGALWFSPATDFPRSWYSWRHQSCGSRCGFVRWRPTCAATVRPTGPRRPKKIRYSIWSATWSAVLDALGAEHAVIAGHDWGAPVAWHAALIRPDRFRAVIGLSVPTARLVAADQRQCRCLTRRCSSTIIIFSSPVLPEAQLERDRKFTVRATPCSALPAKCSHRHIGVAVGGPCRHGAAQERVSRRGLTSPPPLPAMADARPTWIFSYSSSSAPAFGGGLNWGCNIDRGLGADGALRRD